MGAKYIIDGDIIQGIADGVRTMYCETDTMTPAQIESKIKNTRIGVPIDVTPVSHINPTTGRWERPSEWPDLGSLTIGDDFDGVYLTYDLTKINTPWIGVFVQLNALGNICIDRGHIANGEFVVDEHHTQVHNSYYREFLDTTYGDYQVFRITPETSDLHIIYYGFASSESSNTDTCLANNYQPCVERIGRTDYINSFQSYPNNMTYICYSTGWLEHDHVECAGLNLVTQFTNAWNNAVSLQEVYVDWDTSNWNVTTLYSMFSNCSMLRNIIGIENWDTSNWSVTSNGLVQAFYACSSLKHLPIGGWDTSGWSPNSMQSMFTYCRNLMDLDLSGWNTSNWEITSLYTMFMNCESLVKLDLSTWDTSNWAVTTISYLFGACSSLQSIDIGGWDVSGWNPSSLLSLFSQCYSLKEIDLSGWDVSEWDALSNISALFSQCYSLKKLKTEWDTSNWNITNCTNILQGCLSLTEFDIGDWDVSNWDPPSLSSFFNSCDSLTEINLSKWDCSNWVSLNRIDSMFAYCHNLRKIVLPASLDLSGVTNVTDLIRNVRTITNINRMGVPKGVNYSELYYLSPQSLVNILASLPTVSTATTITIGANNQHKLTAAEIAVATQKGWTVA